MGSSPGWTQKPCHGCGSTTLHRKDKLCHDCQHLLEDGRSAHKNQELQLQQDQLMVTHCSAFHMISGPYLFDNSANFIGSRINERLRHAWSDLTLSIIEPALGRTSDAIPLITDKTDVWGVKNDHFSYGGREYFLVMPKTRDALNEFDLSLRLALQYVCLAGKQQGLNILAKLNDGKVTLSDYERQAETVENRLKQLGEQVECGSIHS